MKKKEHAKESEKTIRAREKLIKQLENIENQITSEALKEKTIEIHRWIARHAKHRVVLQNKNISLFDENQNTAKVSKYVTNLFQKVKDDSVTDEEREKSFLSRFTKKAQESATENLSEKSST